jgi:Ca2+-binding EF-hand superfamily protein
MLTQSAIPLTLIISLALSAPVFARGGSEMGRGSEQLAKFIAQYDLNQDGMISAEEIQAARAAKFQQADTNNNGVLELLELQADMENRRTERQATRFAQIDTNEDGQLSVAEFQSSHPQAHTGMTATLFGLADQDKSEALNLEEFAALKSPEGKVWHHFAQLDSNGDGVISEEEYTTAKMAGGGRGPSRGHGPRGDGPRGDRGMGGPSHGGF